MALVSMTGFAEAAGGREALRWRWEAKSVNGRGLDLRLRTPPGFDSVEPAARTLATERFKRGSIQASLTLDTEAGVRGLRIDAVALAAAVKIAKEIAAETGLPPARVDGLLGLKGVIVQEDTLPLDARERGMRDAAVLETLAIALDALSAARATEGAKLGKLLGNLIDEIAGHVESASKIAATQPQIFRERLAAQLNELLAPSAVPEDRLAQEVAMLAARADVREELDRLTAHVHEARLLLSSGDAVGRKLDFLAQEFNREANTLCSKSSDIALTRVGLALKAAIDQFREQSMNIE
ncbi:MAG TPA: YicC/YloC family endoribonuclease [Rhizomicrobium sp.]